MKKRLVMFLTLAMMSSFVFGGTSVFAEAAEETEATEAAAEVVELNWSEIEGQIKESGIEGDFVTFDQIAMKVWVPSVLKEVELTEEDVENGYIGYYATDDQAAAMAIVYVNVDGMDLDAYTEKLAEDPDVKNPSRMVINGYDCLNYDLESNDSTNVAFATEMGAILEFTFSPMSDEGFASTASLMAASIQPE